ncbi:MBL fold metallo-hydrolase [Anabaena cylindrica UHCC 0172]|uniref:MBL fold metallo-hydrolase n=1 Tax=Anabaena cylindrica TaxID=1165 RepID=UPI002B1F35BC|nr:MBL fold metallo-hydrolase [Anabaena cylindrica]MEA5551098.1 MBL fold metallo-hydrolase [Anabaena cylindrica UHCC 0172]
MPNFELSDSQTYVDQEITPMLNNLAGEFWVKFWGVRGLIPTPNSHTCGYGSNTACVEIYVAGKRLVFDGGTGLRVLGKTWQQQQKPLEAHLFFTNCQSNRIQGFPFFAPAFITENSFHIYGTAASNGASIKQCLCDQMLQPHFPYPLQVMQSELLFYNLTPGNPVELGEVTITTALINRNQRSIGYRISWGDYSVAYATDLHQSLDLEEQKQILQIIDGVDLLVTNATYTPPTDKNHEYAELLWKTPVDLAQNAGVKRLVISHHHPDDDDVFLDQIQNQLKAAFPNVLLASEGMVLPVNQ